MKLVSAFRLGFFAAAISSMAAVGAADVKALSTIAVQGALEELLPQFEKASGHKVGITFGLGGPLAKRVQDGEFTDVLVSTRGAIDGLVKSGRMQAGSDASLARSSVAVGIRKGAAKPDISSPEALKRALQSAKAISYSNPAFGGASGMHFTKVLDRLGIAEEMKAKTKFAPEGGLAGPIVMAGDADLAIQQVGELISVPGIEVVGPLPGDLGSVTTFAAGITADARQAEAARALIRFLQSPQARAVMKARGLEPVE